MIADLIDLDCDPALEVAFRNEGTVANDQEESVHRRNIHLDSAYHFARSASKQNIADYKNGASEENSKIIMSRPLGPVLSQELVAAMGLHKNLSC